MNGTMILCVCGRVCSSHAGFALHQKKCVKVIEAKKAGRPIMHESSKIESEIVLLEDIRNFLSLAETIAYDANKALTTNNKSAGRRARILLLDLKNKIIPLRRSVLKATKVSEIK